MLSSLPATSQLRFLAAFIAVLGLPATGFCAAVIQITQIGSAVPGGTITLTISVVETGGVPTTDANLETDGVFGFDFPLSGFDSNFVFLSFTPASPATPNPLVAGADSFESIPNVPFPASHNINGQEVGNDQAIMTTDNALTLGTVQVQVANSAPVGSTATLTLSDVSGAGVFFGSDQNVDTTLYGPGSVLTATVTSIPEPSSFLFVGLILGGVILRHRLGTYFQS